MPEKKREGFTFYWSFYEVTDDFTDEEKKDFFKYIIEYALLGKEPEIEDRFIKKIFGLIKQNISSSIKKYDQRKEAAERRKSKTQGNPYKRTENEEETKIERTENEEETKKDNTNTNTNTNTTSTTTSTFNYSSSSRSGNPIIALPLNGKTQFKNIYEGDLTYYSGLYPNVDILQEFRNMFGWLNAHPTRRKTARGIDGFINSWLCKKQDQGRKPDNRHETESFSPSEIVNLGREMERYE